MRQSGSTFAYLRLQVLLPRRNWWAKYIGYITYTEVLGSEGGVTYKKPPARVA